MRALHALHSDPCILLPLHLFDMPSQQHGQPRAYSALPNTITISHIDTRTPGRVAVLHDKGAAPMHPKNRREHNWLRE